MFVIVLSGLAAMALAWRKGPRLSTKVESVAAILATAGIGYLIWKLGSYFLA